MSGHRPPCASNKKSRIHEAGSVDSNHENSNTKDDPPAVVQQLALDPSTVWTLYDFVQVYAPQLVASLSKSHGTPEEATRRNMVPGTFQDKETNKMTTTSTTDPNRTLESIIHSTLVVPLESWPLDPVPVSNRQETEPQPEQESTKQPVQNKYKQKLTEKKQCEPLPSLVDHVVWTLVKRRERARQEQQQQQQQASNLPALHRHTHSRTVNKPSHHTHSNVLCQGYVSASSRQVEEEGGRSLCTMPAGVIWWQWNRHVEFLKTSSWGRLVHAWLGDNLLRALLLHTQLFLPIMERQDTSAFMTTTADMGQRRDMPETAPEMRGNYFQLTGPPLAVGVTPHMGQARTKEQEGIHNKKTKKRMRNRKRKRSTTKCDTSLRQRANDATATTPASLDFDTAASSKKRKVVSKEQPGQGATRTPTIVSKEDHPPLTTTMTAATNICRAQSTHPTRSILSLVGLSAQNQSVTAQNKRKRSDPESTRTSVIIASPEGTVRESTTETTSPSIRENGTTLEQPRNVGEEILWNKLMEKLMGSKSQGLHELPVVDKKPVPKQQCGHESALALCQSILRKHRKCDYIRILEQYCPLPEVLGHRKGCKSDKGRPKRARLTVDDLTRVSASFTPSHQVVSFVKSALTRVFPLECWGSEQNRTCVLHQVECFINLRRQEHFPFHNRNLLLHGIGITKIPWLFNRSDARRKNETQKFSHPPSRGRRKTSNRRKFIAKDHKAAEERFLSFLDFVFQDFVIHLLQSCFHATESEMYARRVLYYRKPVWSLFCTLSMEKLSSSSSSSSCQAGTKQCMYHALTWTEAAAKMSEHEMGISRLRLVPKRTGVRPIALQSTAARIQPLKRGCTVACLPEERPCPKTQKRKVEQQEKRRTELDAANEMLLERKSSTNDALNDTFAVIRKQYTNDPSLFGAGVAGLHFFYPRYRQFMLELRQSSPTKKGNKRLCFASVDIQNCYDQINQEKLLELVDQQLVRDRQYMVQRVAVTYCRQTRNKKETDQQERPSHLHRKHCHVESMTTFQPTGEALLENMNRQYHCAIFRHAVGAGVFILSKKRLISLLTEHLRSHVLVSKGRFKEHFFLQKRGIPQGSILSSLLCNLYYGSVVEKSLGLLGSTSSSENRVASVAETRTEELPKLDETQTSSPPHALLARMVDDFLLISQRRQELRTFLETMHQGNAELGAQINREKTQVSVHVTLEEKDDPGSDTKTTLTTRRCLNPTKTRRFFPWCGMLFDTRTGHVRIDYSRFQGGKARDSLTVDYSSTTHQGGLPHQLRTQLQTFVRPRCLPILFDPVINGELVPSINFYQLLFFAAVKLVFYVQDLDRMTHLGATHPSSTTSMKTRRHVFLVDCIDATIDFAYALIVSRLTQHQQEEQGPGRQQQQQQEQVLNLPRKRAQWLGWKAVHDVVRRCPDGWTTVLKDGCSQRMAQLETTTDFGPWIPLVRQARRELEPSKLLTLSE